MKSKILTLNDISVELNNKKSQAKILDSISLDIYKSEILGLIEECISSPLFLINIEASAIFI